MSIWVVRGLLAFAVWVLGTAWAAQEREATLKATKAQWEEELANWHQEKDDWSIEVARSRTRRDGYHGGGGASFERCS